MKPVLFLVFLTFCLGGQVTCEKAIQGTDLTDGTSTRITGTQRNDDTDGKTSVKDEGPASNPAILSNTNANRCLPKDFVYLHKRVPHEGNQVGVLSQVAVLPQVECNQTQGKRIYGPDILTPPRQQRRKRHATNLGQSRRKRVVNPGFNSFWKNAIIPFIWDPSLTPSGKDSTIGAMDLYSRYTCIRFVERTPTTATDYNLRHNGAILLLPGGNCASYVGQIGGNQTVYCCQDDLCVHELGHTVGLSHEQMSPLRYGHLRVNWPWVPQDIQNEYIVKMKNSLNGFYDPSSFMHYPDWWGPMTLLAPGIEFLDHRPFYMMKEISLLYQCADKNCTSPPQCDFEGYAKPKPGTWNGTCICQCHDGLDPDTRCTTVAPKVVVSDFPGGSWAMLAPDEGCPLDANLDTGSVTSYVLNATYSAPFSLQGTVNGSMVDLHFCVSQTPDNNVAWPIGKYCILSKNGCPIGFNAGYVQLENECQVSGQATVSQGSLPDGQFSQHVKLMFCCRTDGITNVPMTLANTRPIALLSTSSSSCQPINEMYAKHLVFTITSRKSGIFSISNDTRSIPKIDIVQTSTTAVMSFHYCKYYPLRKDCGGVIELNASSPMSAFSSPGYPNNYDNLLECYYTIRSPVNTTILLNFHDFDLKGSGTSCDDSVQIKQAKLAWHAKSYCGSTMEATYQSTENLMQVILRTSEAGQRRGFSATATYISWADNCYNDDFDGKNYRGTINFTRSFKSCLPWNITTSCPHNSLWPDDVTDGLVSNFCRNPGDGLHPWCYTDLNGCVRDYCDVCLWGHPYDTADDCTAYRAQGMCPQNIQLSREKCAQTCSDQLPQLTAPLPYKQQTCPAPAVPLDGSPSAPLLSRYNVDDEVTFQCRFNTDNVTTRCLSDGTWSGSGYVCGQCPAGWIPYSQGSMGPGCLIFFNDYYLAYSNNVLRCALYGAVLAEPRTLDAATFLAYGKYTGEPVWTGLSKDVNGDLRWQDGSTPVYTNWGPSQPDITPEKKCVVMDTTMAWKTDFCNATYQAACFRPQLQCPYGYRYYEGGLGCIRASTAAKAFDAADQECRAEGAVLARVPFLNAVPYFANWRTGQSDFWVNVKNVSSGNTWSLRDTIGQRIPYSGINVCQHGKNNYSVHEVLSNIPSDKCTRIALANGKAWTPSLCNSTYQFFCERPKVQCPFGYVPVASENGVTECYLQTSLRNNISLATAYCNSLGGILAESKTASASSFLSNFRGDGIAIWLGLRYNLTVKNWVWSNGMIPSNQPWKGGYANGYYVSGQDCATIQTGLWTGRTCKTLYYFYCSKPLECPDGFISYLSGRGCYWKSEQKMNYTNALSTCKSKGAMLAEARDDVANQFFGSLWPANEPYIGLAKISNGTWVWQDGSNTSIYSNYLAGRPYSGNFGLNCTIITASLGWQDSNCSEARYFACTKDQTPKKICADFTSDCKSWVNDIPNFCSLPEKYYMAYFVCPLTCGICRRPCPDGYTQLAYNGDCYRYYSEATYSDAQQQCSADGAVLYPAKTASDVLFLLSFQNSSGIWVGLTDSDTEGTWKYSDETLMTDSSLWMSGEPDNVYQGITPCNCATASLPGNLRDYPCGQKQPFVCKRAYDPM